MKIIIIGLLALSTMSTQTANAKEVLFYCNDDKIADCPAWMVKFNGQTLTIIPNECFPEKIQNTFDKVKLTRTDSDANKPIPLGVYTGKNKKNESLTLTITSLSLSSLEWADINFYSGNLWSDTASVALSCTGPKLGQKL